MSEAGTGGGTPRLDDVERALVLAREVAAATAGGGGANIRTAHLRQLFGNGDGAPSPARIQAALEAAGLRTDPPLTEDPDSVSLHVEGDRASLAAESPTRRRRSSTAAARRTPSQPPARRARNLDFDDEHEDDDPPPAPRRRYEGRPRVSRQAAEPEPKPRADDPIYADDDPNDPDYDLPVSPRFGAAAYEAAATAGDEPAAPPRRRRAPEPEPEPEPDLEFEDEGFEDDYVDEPEAEHEHEPEPETAAEPGPAASAETEPEPDEDRDPDAPLTLADMERLVATRPQKRAPDELNPALLAALMPALIVPVLIAAFVGPLFGAIFAGLCILAAGLLSRPYALADGKLGPIRLPHSLGRSFLVIAILTALLALGMSIALIVAGGSDTDPVDENAPIEQTTGEDETTPNRTPPAPPANETTDKQGDETTP